MSDQPVPGDRPRQVVVIGGGLAGLAAAWFLAEQPGTRVTVLEAADRVGGKIHGAEVGGVRVDVGAESMLNRRPEGVGLVRALNLPVVHPEPVSSRLWTRGTLRPLPPSLMGVPFDAEQVRADDVLSAAGLDRMLAERDLPPTPRAERLAAGEDVSVGDLVAERLGDEVVDRLVEPLLGGVYAGHAREISTRAAVPALVAMAGGGSLLTQAAAIPRTSDVPVFAGIRGGVWQLPRALAESGRFEVRTGCTVRALTRTPTGFRLITGPTTDEQPIDADAVVVAAPAAASGRLLTEVAPGAATELSAIETASMAVISLAFPVDRAETLDGLGSGFLVPPVDRRRIKAATFSFAKWGWVRAAGDGLLLMRTSIGRHREAAALQADDSELVARSLADLAEATGLDADPVDVRVQRWGGGLPQYAVGHPDRVRRIRDAVARVDGLAVCGASYDGVGIPAVIASARAAADRLRPASGDAAQ